MIRIYITALRWRVIIGLAAIPVASTSASAVAQTAPVSVDGPIEQLKPGEYLWAPEIAPEGPVTLIVSLKTQRA